MCDNNVQSVKRKRGRPRKHPIVPKVKGKRGRPRKNGGAAVSAAGLPSVGGATLSAGCMDGAGLSRELKNAAVTIANEATGGALMNGGAGRGAMALKPFVNERNIVTAPLFRNDRMYHYQKIPTADYQRILNDRAFEERRKREHEEKDPTKKIQVEEMSKELIPNVAQVEAPVTLEPQLKTENNSNSRNKAIRLAAAPGPDSIWNAEQIPLRDSELILTAQAQGINTFGVGFRQPTSSRGFLSRIGNSESES